MISTLALIGFVVTGLCGGYRLLRGPDLADRIIALDVTLISLMGGIVIDGVLRGDTTNFMLLVVLSIVGFTATVAATRYLEHQAEVVD